MLGKFTISLQRAKIFVLTGLNLE